MDEFLHLGWLKAFEWDEPPATGAAFLGKWMKMAQILATDS